MHAAAVYGTLTADIAAPTARFIDVHERNSPKHKVFALQPQRPDDAFRPAFILPLGDAAAFGVCRAFA